MPKVNLNPERAAAQELNRHIAARMAYCGYSKEQAAEKIHMTPRTFYRRMATPGTWELSELLNLNRILGLNEPLAQCFGLRQIN
jgi:hypothetical protein